MMKLERGGNARKVCRGRRRLNLLAPLRALAFVGQASHLFRERLLAGPVEMGSLRNILPCPRRLPPPKHLPPRPPDIPPSTTTALHRHISPFYSPAWLSDASETSLVRLHCLLFHVEPTASLVRFKTTSSTFGSAPKSTATLVLPVNSPPNLPLLLLSPKKFSGEAPHF